MNQTTSTPPLPTPNSQAETREERLAAKLRENLHRRKAQARAMTTPGVSSMPDAASADLPGDPLSKAPPKS